MHITVEMFPFGGHAESFRHYVIVKVPTGRCMHEGHGQEVNTV